MQESTTNQEALRVAEEMVNRLTNEIPSDSNRFSYNVMLPRATRAQAINSAIASLDAFDRLERLSSFMDAVRYELRRMNPEA